MVSVSSMVSLVVPGISDTIALSSLSSELSKVDLPTFGLPIMATGIPCFNTFPIANELTKADISVFNVVSKVLNCALSANSTSSSLKSNSNSIREAKFTNCFRNSLILEEKPPRICSNAKEWDDLECDAIKSATASACDKSNLAFRKARIVNSPGLAILAPLSINNSSIFC